MNNLPKIPTIADLVSESDNDYKENALMVILNQPPPEQWLKPHPTAKTKDAQGNSVPARYLPIERVEYLLSRIFGKWNVEIKNVQVLANSIGVTVRLYVTNPITGEIEWQDGFGASPIQTNSGAGAMDWNQAKSAGVQMAGPSAESYAIKDAAEKFGKLFGKDANRQTQIDYTHLLKSEINKEDLQLLFDMKKEALSKSERIDAERILNNNETKSYSKLHKTLLAL
jgi:hypothetical protein